MEPLSPRDPRTVGEFRLRGRLGSGGMGRVFLGHSPAGRAVAVKVVRPELAGDPEFTRRFAQEVDAAKAVSGMYTAPVVAAGLDDDPPWLATAFVPGPSLAELVETRGPLPETAVWRLAAGLAEALRAVHACGLVHRDLKPANVLLALDGPHLIDFGISRALDGVSLTRTGMVMGTPGYMAPEQAEGLKAGPPGDVFSLGALLAFAATGKAPFGLGSAPAILYRLVSGEPDLDGVPAGLRTVIAACMAKVPERRPDLPSLAGLIAKHGPGLSFTSGTTAFWPSEVSGFIRQAQPDFERADDREFAAAGAARTGSARRQSRDGKTKVADDAPGYRAPGYAAPRYDPPPAPGQNAPYGPYTPYGPNDRQYNPRQYGARRPDPALRHTPMVAASRLMRLGAAVTVLDAIVTLSSIAHLKASALARHPMMSPAAVRSAVGGAVGTVIVGAAIGIVLWLLLAGAARRGRRWVRPTGTAVFGLYTLAVAGTLQSPAIAATKGLGVVIWIVGLLAVIAMWSRRAPR